MIRRTNFRLSVESFSDQKYHRPRLSFRSQAIKYVIMVESCFEPISISTRTLLNIFPTDASEDDIQCNFAQLFGVVPDGVYAQIILRLNCSDIYAHTLHRKYSHLGSGSPSDLTHFRGGFPKLEKRAPGDRTWKPVPHFAAYERSQEFVKLK